MCGFVGVVGAAITAEDRHAVNRACGYIERRGPDAKGLYAGDGVVMGHRRLSIIDPNERSNQPFLSPRGGEALVFNGEIYNYKELSQQAHGDTEVLARFARHPRALRGMFAYAFWDAKAHELMLVRDPVGIKPLYIAPVGSKLYFGSSVIALSVATGRRAIDAQSLAQYLRYGSVWGEASLIRGIREVPPGTVIRWRGGSSWAERYWDLSILDPSHSDATVGHAIRDSVLSHMVADVPLAMFLSGGIDSTAIAACARGSTHKPLAVTLTFPRNGIDESKAAGASADAYGFRHLVASAGMSASDIIDATSQADQPSIDGLNVFLVSRIVQQAGIKVALSGLGADELFGGYRNHLRMPLLAAVGRAMKNARWPQLSLVDRLPPKLAAIIRGGGDIASVYAELRSVRDVQAVHRLCGYHALEPQRPSHDMPLHFKLVQLELSNYLRYTLLRDTDTFSMLNSVEVRVPYLDGRVIGALMGLSPLVLMAKRKRLLVDALNDAHLSRVASRPKQGFTVPYQSWLETPSIRERLEEIGNGPASTYVSLTRNDISSNMGGAEPPNTSAPARWSLVILDAWLRRLNETWNLTV